MDGGLRRRFKAFATVCVFIALKNGNESAPLRAQVLLQSVPSLTTNDIAVFSGILGSKVLRLYWATPNDDLDCADYEPCLYFDFKLDEKEEEENRPTKRQRQRRKTTSVLIPDPVRRVTALLTTFDATIQESGDTEESLASKYLPPPLQPQKSATNDNISMDDVVADLSQQPFYRSQIVSATVDPAVTAQYTTSHDHLSMDSSVWAALLETRGIEQLYSHQAQAIDFLMQGHDVVVSTATASGKSVIYQLPILDLLIRDPQARILVVYPTKALAQDQLAALKELIAHIPALCNVLVSTLDGDTPATPATSNKSQNQRAVIRMSASVILTNPDTLHVAMLPGVAR
ncbi:ATP-dependent 3'-5' DNA helicase, partial [Coemansia aciculifera]